MRNEVVCWLVLRRVDCIIGLQRNATRDFNLLSCSEDESLAAAIALSFHHHLPFFASPPPPFTLLLGGGALRFPGENLLQESYRFPGPGRSATDGTRAIASASRSAVPNLTIVSRWEILGLFQLLWENAFFSLYFPRAFSASSERRTNGISSSAFCFVSLREDYFTGHHGLWQSRSNQPLTHNRDDQFGGQGLSWVLK